MALPVKCFACEVDFKTGKTWKWNPETQEKEEVTYLAEPVVKDGDQYYHPRCAPTE